MQKEKPCAGVPRAEKAGHRASFASRERVKGDVRHVLGGWQYSYCHDFYFFKWWKCGLIVSRGEFLIISVTTSYIKGIKNRDTFTSRISPLFCWFQFEFTEKEIFSLSVLFSPPPLISGMKDVGSRNPRASCVIFPNNFWLRYSSLYFLAMASLSPLRMMASCQRRRVIQGWGGSTWVALVTPSPLDIRCRHDEKRVSPGLKRKQLLCAAQHGAAACCLYTNRKGGYGYSLFFWPPPFLLGVFWPILQFCSGVP